MMGRCTGNGHTREGAVERVTTSFPIPFRKKLYLITKGAWIIMASKNQEKIDNYAAELTDTFDKLAAEVEALKEQVRNGEVLNFGGLDAQVKRGQDMEAPRADPEPDVPSTEPVSEEPAPSEDSE